MNYKRVVLLSGIIAFGIIQSTYSMMTDRSSKRLIKIDKHSSIKSSSIVKQNSRNAINTSIDFLKETINGNKLPIVLCGFLNTVQAQSNESNSDISNWPDISNWTARAIMIGAATVGLCIAGICIYCLEKGIKERSAADDDESLPLIP